MTATAPEHAPDIIETFRGVREDFTRLMLSYQFGMDEITTKIRILREEFDKLHSYNPIEQVTTRLKSAESVVDKVTRKGLEPSLSSFRKITDIAGVRVTCSFTADTYRVFEALTGQPDVRVLEVKDYIAHPKPNGYRSLHAIVEVPVFLSSRTVNVPVEVQFRTVAMDFWATLEHKIFYKYDGDVPPEVVLKLEESAETAAQMDRDMEALHDSVHGPRDFRERDRQDDQVISDDVVRKLSQFLSGEGG
ncbi:MAG: GTP pyrophosphokinase [Gulosibacter sp.]|uniref:GTP pyrophosphokinase n=1 Tax=Gulosibacter sp. TaxID=2817531 RepID=UPI003F8EA94F